MLALAHRFLRRPPDRSRTKLLRSLPERSAALAGSKYRSGSWSSPLACGAPTNSFFLSVIRGTRSIISGNGCAGTKSGQPLQFIETRNAPEHVFKARLIGLVVGNKLDRRGASGPLLHQLSETLNRHSRNRCPRSRLRRPLDPSQPVAESLRRNPAHRRSIATAGPFRKP